jgi:hypothetical protein
MPHTCPSCGKVLRGDYLARTPITQNHHGNDKKCPGIGEMGIWASVESSNQQKNKARVAGSALSAEHKEQKSVSNLKTYQTPHHNAAVQKDRENKAKNLGLPGHGSADSNSKKNNATKSKLDQINKK